MSDELDPFTRRRLLAGLARCMRRLSELGRMSLTGTLTLEQKTELERILALRDRYPTLTSTNAAELAAAIDKEIPA